MNSLRKLQLNNDDNDENDDDEIAFSLPDGKTGNPYVGRVMRTSRKIYYTWTKLLQLCHNLFLVPFFFPLFVFHKMFSYAICIATPIAGGKQRETKREREFPSAVQLRILHALNLYFFTGCDNSDRDKQLKQVFKNAQSVKKTWAMQTWATWGFCNELLYIKCDTSHELNQINQSKMSCRKDSVFWKTFPGMLRLGPSDSSLAQPTPISHLMEDGKNTTANFSFSWKLGYGL